MEANQGKNEENEKIEQNTKTNEEKRSLAALTK